jgi:glycosyltransferase involved in cell wall biosynthesis
MRIGFDAQCAENRSGTGRYATELLLALAAIDRENTYEICARRSSPLVRHLASYRNFHVHPIVRDGLAARILFENSRLASWIARQGLDLFHGPAFVLPKACPAPAVVTVHDLVFRLFPETIPAIKRRHYQRVIPRSIAQADLVLADSASTARDLETCLGVAPSRIRTVPLGVGERFFTTPDPGRAEEVRRRYQLPQRFILTVGTLEPRKNLPLLFRAYADLLAEVPEAPELVVFGRRGWGVRGLEREIRRLGIAARVLLRGFAVEEDLPGLYHLATLFVCASRYEGFGLPVLEAMASGAPVVAGDHSSLPEITGTRDTLVDCRDPRAFARRMGELLRNPEAACKQAERGRRRAREFTWRSTAEGTLDAYRTALARQPGGEGVFQGLNVPGGAPRRLFRVAGGLQVAHAFAESFARSERSHAFSGDHDALARSRVAPVASVSLFHVKGAEPHQ